MPTISVFYGIIIRLYYEDHTPLHLHACYQDRAAAFDFDGGILSGEMPAKQQKLIGAWTQIHRDELDANRWLASAREAVERIDPLR